MTISARLATENAYDLHIQPSLAAPSALDPASTEPVSFPGTLNNVLVAIVGLTTACLALAIGVVIDPASFAPFGLVVSTCLLLDLYVGLRRTFGDIFRERLQLVLRGLAFIVIAMGMLRIFNHLTMSFPLPLADQLLDGWDKALGFDWLPYFGFVQTHPMLNTILKYAYIAFDGACLFGFITLAIMGRLARARYFCEIFLITATLAIAIAMFFPAVAAVAFYFGPVDQIEGFSMVPGVAHVDQMLSLREAEVPSINLLDAAGLAAFPSFHTAGGILLITGFYRTRLFWFATAFAVVMIPSVPVFGGHYFVDILAGTALALAVSVLNARRRCYRGLFGKDKTKH
jgi:hypothetical protein